MKAIHQVLFFAAVLHLAMISAQEVDLISSITVTKNKISVVANEAFTKKYLTEDFFAQYDKDIDLRTMDYSLQTLPFVLHAISIVWVSGETYYIDSMDLDIFNSLARIKQVFKRMYPNTSFNGHLLPRTLVQNRRTWKNKTALFFSGGLDSTAAALERYNEELLLITARGQWDVPLYKDDLWKRRKNELRAFAKKYGHKTAFIRSNYSQFLNWDALGAVSDEIVSWRSDANEGIGMFGLAVPILYQKGYPSILISASYHWSYPYPSAANPLIDNNLVCAEQLKLRHVHFDKSRADKLFMISQMAQKGLIERHPIKVCDGQNATNCLDDDCQKCVPTAFTLLALGEDARKFGFPYSDEKIMAAAKKYLSNPRKYWELWELQELQDMLKEKKKDPRYCHWFLKKKLSKTLTISSVGAKQKVAWHDFHDLAPDGLTIPKNGPKEL